MYVKPQLASKELAPPLTLIIFVFRELRELIEGFPLGTNPRLFRIFNDIIKTYEKLLEMFEQQIWF
jgi:hypothetical protein